MSARHIKETLVDMLCGMSKRVEKKKRKKRKNNLSARHIKETLFDMLCDMSKRVGKKKKKKTTLLRIRLSVRKATHCNLPHTQKKENHPSAHVKESRL